MTTSLESYQGMSEAERAELIAQLRAENEALRKASASPPKTLKCKVGEKGGVSVYGLGRFPVTLYKSQWLRLFAYMDIIKDFLRENDAYLKEKE